MVELNLNDARARTCEPGPGSTIRLKPHGSHVRPSRHARSAPPATIFIGGRAGIRCLQAVTAGRTVISNSRQRPSNCAQIHHLSEHSALDFG